MVLIGRKVQARDWDNISGFLLFQVSLSGKYQRGVLNLNFSTSLNKALTICAESWLAWRFTYHYAWCAPKSLETPPPIYISNAHYKVQIRSRKTREERSRETEKGSVQSPSENSPRISGEVKINLELRIRSKSRDEQIFYLLR